jgi:hypothetical protein
MPNPFFFAGKITNPEHFVGREKELKKIFGYLDTAHTGQIQHVSVVGERRIGKSSLLYHLSQTYTTRLSNNGKYRFVYLDLDNPHCHTLHGLLRYILDKLDLPAPSQPTLARFYDLIEQEHEKKDIWPVLLMDEFEHLPSRVTEFPDQFYEALRSLGNNNIVGLITASQHTLQNMASKEKLTSPFFNIFHQIDLGEFPDVEAQALLNRGRVSDQAFTNGDCEQIIKIAGKHPARLQVVAGLTYETKSNNQPLDWKNIKAEAINEPLFNNHRDFAVEKTNWFVSAMKWLFWRAPQYLGNMIMVVINRGEHTNERTDRMIGYIAYIIIIGVLAGIIPWPLVTKMIRRISELFFQ